MILIKLTKLLWETNVIGNILSLVLSEDEFDDAVTLFPLLILHILQTPSGIALKYDVQPTSGLKELCGQCGVSGLRVRT